MSEDRRELSDESNPTGGEVGVPRSSAAGLPSATPEQQLAAQTLDRHVAVTAGPGAGKTTVLVERYLRILRTRDVSVDQIVAITFTNRAANEMRERLRRELDKLLDSSSPIDRAKWMRHKRTLDGAIITTIHGFCARLLREFPVEADLDPQFALLDAHQSAMLEESVAEEVITGFIGSGHQPITELAAGVGRASLARGLIDIYRSMRNQGLTIDKLKAEAAHNHKTLRDYECEVQKLAERMRGFIGAGNLSVAAEEKRREAERRWPAFRGLLTSASESTRVTELAGAVQEFREATRPSTQRRINDLVKDLDELIWKEKLGGSVPRAFVDLHARKSAIDLIGIVEALEQKLDEEKRRGSVLDFDDLQLRALRLLEQHPEVMRRTERRYRFFLVDEFQDTNGLQRDLMAKLALGGDRRANLFIVGDRKQSIYGFRGADVDVFRDMAVQIVARGGLPVTLNRNFRSQPPLIRFLNFVFERVFEPGGRESADELNELGYVEHERSIAAREDQGPPPVVELLADLKSNDNTADESSPRKPRERDAEQIANRIIALVGRESISVPAASRDKAAAQRTIEYRDIALLFRAMTEAHIYESAFRRAGIPYVTVDGKGFYAREEITDLVQLLRFLDNRTDEVALAAVLRSPLAGLSDETLLALRCAPLKAGSDEHSGLRRRGGVRRLLKALSRHEAIELIDDQDRPALTRSRELLSELLSRAKRMQVSELLRFAVDASEYRAVVAANFDGAQRLANIEKLFTLAERFERSGAYLIRDFVRFVHEFEEAGGRESEGQLDDSADAIRLMSIHQSKGLEFPVVVIPDLHRLPDNRREWWALDRHRGLTLKVPDGRGNLVAGAAFTNFTDRAKRREEFESMRLLYVAATRAKDRLILSGAAKDLASSNRSWLGWIARALDAGKAQETQLLIPADGVEVQLRVARRDALKKGSAPTEAATPMIEANELAAPEDQSFPLLQPIQPERLATLHRFSVTQLLNYQRCPRQYYFDRVLHAPGDDELAVWNDAEAPEPPSNLTATLRGAVIHRFCEKHGEGDDTHEVLKTSFDEVLAQRAAELAERVLEIDREKAVRDLLPLAENYVASKVRQRIESTRSATDQESRITNRIPLGVLSEQRFRLRRPLGILSGTIDKLLVRTSTSGEGLDVEIIDFKTNRFRRGASFARTKEGTRHAGNGKEQLSFGFVDESSLAATTDDLLLRSEVNAVAEDYRIQMQAYALAARELIPGASTVRVTLHFVDPDLEVSLPEERLDREACSQAIDETMLNIVSSSSPESFPAHPAEHCRMCGFLDMCAAGQSHLHSA